MTDTLQVNTKRRPHSNTVSGGRPPALDISLSRPTNARRNSEGSPGLPPPISISEATPIEPSEDAKENVFFNKSRPSSPSEPAAVTTTEQKNNTPQPEVRGSATAPVGSNNMLDSPTSTPKKKSRSRASSVTSNLLTEIKESSTIQSLANKIKSRHSEENGNAEPNVPAERNSSEGNISVATASIAGTSGMDLASAKRNQDFHALFRSVPEEDSLIEDFGCALQKEILLQGRIYISENYLCFNANIFGWVTNLVIAFADIVDIEKKTTAYVIPNAIQVSTENAKHFFASFLSRDQAYDLMVDIWRTVKPINDPEQESSIQNEQEESSSEYSDDDESGSNYDSDTEDSYSDYEEDSAQMEVTDTAVTRDRIRKESMASLPNTKEVKSMDSAARRRAMSEAVRPSFSKSEEKAPSTAVVNEPSANAKEKTSPSNGNNTSTAGSDKAEAKPQVHEKTECGCSSSDHYPNVVMDQVYNGTLEKIYNLMFDSGFMKKFLVENQKSLELEMGEWKKGEGNVEYVKEMSYIKPLGGAIGPKQTKCIITQEVLHQDMEKYVSVLTTTSTPDVPSGSSFSCKTLTCMTWAGKGKVRVLVTVQVEFTKSSWLKSTIEKASIDGQQTYYKDLDAAVRAYCKEHPNEFVDYSKRSSSGKRRKRGKKSKSHSPKPEPAEHKQEKPKSMVHQVLGSVSNTVADGITSVIDIITSPKSTHFTLLCLIAMVVINIYIARKMAFVEQQLGQLSHSMPSVDQVEDKVHIPGAHRREYNRQEEQDLWEWLGRMDPDKSSEKREQISFPTVSNSKEQEAIWDDAIRASQSAKDRLDKHMIELSNMIQKAESNLQDVTKSVNEQRAKMQQQQEEA